MKILFAVLGMFLAVAAVADTDKKLSGEVSINLSQSVAPFSPNSGTNYKVIQIVDQTRKVICYAVVSERGPATGTTPPSSCVKFE